MIATLPFTEKKSILRCFPCINMNIFSISISVSNLHLSLVAALKDFSNAEGVSSKRKTLFMIFNPSNFSLSVFAAKISPARLLVRDCQCLSPSRRSKSVLPVFELLLSQIDLYQQDLGHLSHSIVCTAR